MHLNQPIVGMAPTPSGTGYWLVASRRRHLHASATRRSTARPAACTSTSRSSAWRATPTGHGYWLVASDGGIFTFGDAKFHGSTGGQPLVAPIIAIIPTVSGRGYWLVGLNGDVFPFGDARFYGSAGGRTLTAPIVGGAASRHK